MTVEEYKKLYDKIVSLSIDAESFGLGGEFDAITDEDFEKCKYIAAMYACLSDVPVRRANFIFKQKEFSEEDFDEWYDEMVTNR